MQRRLLIHFQTTLHDSSLDGILCRMGKKDRQQKLLDLIKVKRISNQHDLLVELGKIGIEANQASISRDLNELSIAKVQGVYCVPQIRPGESSVTDFVDIDSAGDHLLIVKTFPGKAMSVAKVIDDLNLAEVIGTLAGDDTIFVATKDAARQKSATQKIMKRLQR